MTQYVIMGEMDSKHPRSIAVLVEEVYPDQFRLRCERYQRVAGEAFVDHSTQHGPDTGLSPSKYFYGAYTTAAEAEAKVIAADAVAQTYDEEIKSLEKRLKELRKNRAQAWFETVKGLR